jgi:hypothetical protein
MFSYRVCVAYCADFQFIRPHRTNRRTKAKHTTVPLSTIP